MASNYRHNYILFSICIVLAIAGCRCKHGEPEPKPDTPSYNCWDYWPDNANKEWIYEVKKVSGTSLIYVYDDTLKFLKDSVISQGGGLVFKTYGFCKQPSKYNFVIGNYPANKNSMFICLSGQNYYMFDLAKVQDSGTYQKYQMDGSPFDTRYNVAYSTPIQKNINTLSGKFNALNSYIVFAEQYGANGYLRFSHQSYLAKGAGLVKYEFSYDRYKVPLNNDSSITVQYNLKKIIN